MSRSSARRAAVALLLLAVGGWVGACSSAEPAPEEPAPSTLAQVDASGIEVPRLDFCSLVPADAVTTALGGEPQDTSERAPGEPDSQAGETGQPLQEVGCTWTGSAATASAWVFAEPVDADEAARLAEGAGAQQGCTTEPAAYGDPGVRQECPGQTTDSPRVRYAGLLGDTWLTCELQGTGAAARAETWCVALLTSLDPEG